MPIGCYTIRQNNELYLRALIGAPDGSKILRAEGKSAVKNAQDLGIRIAEQLLAQGGDKILQSIYQD